MPNSTHHSAEPEFEELSAYLDGELQEDRLYEIDMWLLINPQKLAQLRRIRTVEKTLFAGFRARQNTGKRTGKRSGKRSDN